MSNVRAGIFFLPTGNGTAEEVYEQTLELIQATEALGFHAAWVSQLHFQSFRGRLSSPFPFLVRAADRTKKTKTAQLYPCRAIRTQISPTEHRGRGGRPLRPRSVGTLGGASAV